MQLISSVCEIVRLGIYWCARSRRFGRLIYNDQNGLQIFLFNIFFLKTKTQAAKKRDAKSSPAEQTWASVMQEQKSIQKCTILNGIHRIKIV